MYDLFAVSFISVISTVLSDNISPPTCGINSDLNVFGCSNIKWSYAVSASCVSSKETCTKAMVGYTTETGKIKNIEYIKI